MSAEGSGSGSGMGEPKEEGKGEETVTSVEYDGKSYKPLADGKYDAIVLGTGLPECIISGLLSKKGKKVLHLDRNSYYGSESASLNLSNLFRKFISKSDSKDEEPPDDFFDKLGQNRDYNVDLVPKFLMADGNLVKILIETGVNNYLDFKQVGGSYVWKSGGEVHKVPATEMDAVKTGLMGFFQKRKFRSFLQFVAGYDETDKSTHQGMDLTTVTMAAVYKKFGLDENSQDFTGHAMALYTEDSYLTKPALETIKAIKLYAHSLDRYGTSPFIYPVYGLGGLPEGFSRLCAIHGGTFILNKPVDEILFDKEGVAVGVRSGEGDDAEVATAPFIVGEPSYFPPKMRRSTGHVIRSVNILDHPVAAVKDVHSAQVIIPQKQARRAHDIYLSVLSHGHFVAAKGKYIAIASTTVETSEPEKELAIASEMMGAVVCKCNSVTETYEPVDDGRKNKCFISKSYDATSHFESVSSDVMDMWTRITGEPLNLTAEGKA